MTTAAADTSEAHPSGRFFSNVLWSWTGVATSVVSAFFLSRYIIRKLGDERYGIWVLAFGLVEYYWLLDFGFRSATVKYAGHYRALRQPEKINQVINTGLGYFSGIGLLVLLATSIASPYVPRLFNVSPVYHRSFAGLVALIGVSWALGIVCVVFQAALEGFQRFDLAGHVTILSTVLRVCGSFVVLAMGYGLVAMGAVVVASQILGYGLNLFYFRRIFPALRFSRRYYNTATLRDMASYGFHTFTAAIGGQMLNQSPPVLIGIFQPAAYVGYFNIPLRLLNSTVVELTARVAVVSGSKAAELVAREETEAVARLGIYTNRYCLTMYMPVAMLLWLYGYELIRAWLGDVFATQTAALLVPMVTGVGLAIAAQFNSSAILYGLGKHRGYARSLVVEAAANIGLMLLVIPRYGILGAAVVSAVLMALNRGLWTPHLFCQAVGYSWAGYMLEIYARPVLTAIPVAGLLLVLKHSVLPGQKAIELIAVAVIAALAYLPAAFWTCVQQDHRQLIVQHLTGNKLISKLLFRSRI